MSLRIFRKCILIVYPKKNDREKGGCCPRKFASRKSYI